MSFNPTVVTKIQIRNKDQKHFFKESFFLPESEHVYFCSLAFEVYLDWLVFGATPEGSLRAKVQGFNWRVTVQLPPPSCGLVDCICNMTCVRACTHLKSSSLNKKAEILDGRQGCDGWEGVGLLPRIQRVQRIPGHGRRERRWGEMSSQVQTSTINRIYMHSTPPLNLRHRRSKIIH